MCPSAPHSSELESSHSIFAAIVGAAYANRQARSVVALFGAEYEMLADLASKLGQLFPDRFSLEYLQQVLFDTVRLLVKSSTQPDSQHVKEAFDNLLQDLASHEESWTVVIPIENLELAVGPLTVGRVSFRPHGDGGRLAALLGEDSQRLQAELKFVQAYAEVRHDGEYVRVMEKAVNDAEMALHVLRIWASPDRIVRGELRQPTTPSIMGETPYRRRCVYAIPEAGSRPGLAANAYAGRFWWARSSSPLVIDAQSIAAWRRLGFDHLSSMLAGEATGEMQERVLRAVGWIGEARQAGNLEDAFLKNSIALEALLLGPGGDLRDPKASIGSITSQLSERAAFLLGRVQEERLIIVGDIRKLYAIRSAIVHRSAKVGHEDLRLWELYVLHCLSAILVLGLRDIGDLRDWVNHIKYSGDPKSGAPLWGSLYGEHGTHDPLVWRPGRCSIGS